MKKAIITKLAILLIGVSAFTHCPKNSDDTVSTLTTLLVLDPGLFGGCVMVNFGAKSVYPVVSAKKGGPTVNVQFGPAGSHFYGFVTLPGMKNGDQITVTVPATDTMTYGGYRGGCPFSTNTEPANNPATGSEISPILSGDQTTSGTTYSVLVDGNYIIYFNSSDTLDPNFQVQVQVQ